MMRRGNQDAEQEEHGIHMTGDGQMMSRAAMMMQSNEPIEWEDTNTPMNAISDTDTIRWRIVDNETGKEPEEHDWQFKIGDKIKMRISNNPQSMHPMHHPIHIHGQRFLVLARNGKQNDNLVWKDTVLVSNGEYVDLLVDMTNPGIWMVHCHIAEHLEAGMMFSFTLS